MRENCTSGSVRGASGNRRSYRKRRKVHHPYWKIGESDFWDRHSFPTEFISANVNASARQTGLKMQGMSVLKFRPQCKTAG